MYTEVALSYRRNEPLQHTNTWIDLKFIMLRERSQSQRLYEV